MVAGLLPDLITTNFTGITGTCQSGIYLFLFIIIFLENGLPPMIWLPGDSLLFLTGLLAAGGVFDLPTLLIMYSLGAFIGYELNYILGLRIGLPLVTRHFFRIVTVKHLLRSEDFYNRWGNAAITIGRFIPVIRTITPLLAGISRMNISRFTAYNILGAMLWPVTVCGTGYLFGILPWLSEYQDILFNLVSLLFIGSIVISGTLVILSVMRTR
jgi:membrane-associated protein